MKKIIEGIRNFIKGELGLESVLIPQNAKGNTARFDLYLSGIGYSGEGSQSTMAQLKLKAEYVIAGTHEAWLNRAIQDSIKLSTLVDGLYYKTPIIVNSDTKLTLYAVWRRLSEGAFVYPDSDENSMPVVYTESFSITVDFPVNYLENPDSSIEKEIV